MDYRAEVEIPFKDKFKEPMLSGVKIMTARTRKMAEPQERFFAFGSFFQINAVYKIPLALVANVLWKLEGCHSANDFISTWREIHPRKGYDGEQLIYLHTFKRIT